jgi:hypothetical protein
MTISCSRISDRQASRLRQRGRATSASYLETAGSSQARALIMAPSCFPSLSEVGERDSAFDPCCWNPCRSWPPSFRGFRGEGRGRGGLGHREALGYPFSSFLHETCINPRISHFMYITIVQLVVRRFHQCHHVAQNVITGRCHVRRMVRVSGWGLCGEIHRTPGPLHSLAHLQGPTGTARFPGPRS